MPRRPRGTRHRRGSTLRPAMLWGLVHGELPAVQDEPVTWERGFGSGKLDTFILLGHVLDLQWPNPPLPARQALAELRDLYARHGDEIDRAARAAGRKAWAAEFLAEHDPQKGEIHGPR